MQAVNITFTAAVRNSTHDSNKAGFSTPDYKQLLRAIVRSQVTLKRPDMGGKCEGTKEC